MLDTIQKKLAALVPGSRLNIALKKKAYQDALRHAGVSRKESMRLTYEHFKSKDSHHE